MMRVIYSLFVGLLILSPLAFGTVEQWSLTLMETASFLALGLLIFSNMRDKSAFFYETPGLLPLLLFLSYLGIQLIPLPAGAIKFLSRGAYSLYEKTAWIGESDSWGTLSINRKATLLEFFRMVSYAAFYTLSVQLMAKRDLLKKTVLSVMVFASFLSFFAIIQHLLSNNKIFWLRELTRGGVLFGPYVNRNHYAGLMGMLFPIALGVFLYYKPVRTYGSLRERLSGILGQKMANRYVLFGFSAVLIATSIFVSLSRGGIISLSISMIFSGVLIMAREKQRRMGLLIILTFVLILYSVGWFGWSEVFARFEGIRNIRGEIAELRFEIWKDSLRIVKDFPLTGTGFGGFASIYQKYRSISAPGIVDHAHNDYLELLAEGGIIAFLLMGWFLTEVIYRSYSILLKRHEAYSIYLCIGSITGIISILVHSFTDFNLHIGANGLYFFFLSGLAVSASHTRLYAGPNDTYLRRISTRYAKQACLVVAAVLICSLTVNVGVVAGNFYHSLIRNTRPDTTTSLGDLTAIRNAAYRASVCDPLEADYQYIIANSEWLSNNKTTAMDHYRKTVRLNPANGEYLQTLGLAMSNIQRHEAADLLLRSGIEVDPLNAMRSKRYGSWLIAQGRREDGLRNILRAVSLEPEKTRDYITLLILYGFKDDEIRDALPALVGPHLLFADYLESTGKDELAAEEYRDALNYLRNEKEIKSSYFYRVAQYHTNKGKHDNALEVMKKAVETLPEDINIHIGVAAAYEKAGIRYRAVEEYRKTLVMDPKNETARKRLEALN